MAEQRWYLGRTKLEQYGAEQPIYLTDFSWDCGWYWSGGYLGNRDCLFHFDNAFLETPDIRGHALGDFITPWQVKREHSVVLSHGCSVWEDISLFLDNVPVHIAKDWWRIKDLFKQFYTLQKAAAVFRYRVNA